MRFFADLLFYDAKIFVYLGVFVLIWLAILDDHPDMRKFYLLFVLILAKSAFCFAALDSISVRKLVELSEQTQKAVIPDKRVAVFNLYEDSTQTYILETTEKQAVTDFMKRYQAAQLNIPLQVKLLPDADLGEKKFGLLNVSVGNIRSQPKNAAEMATQALLGWQVDILKASNGYYLVRTGEGYISWLDAGAVTLKTAKEIDQWNTKRLIFIADYGHSYTEADPESLRVSDLVMGNVLQYLGKQGSFYQVKYPDGRMAYVPKDQMVDFAAWKEVVKPTAEHIISTAKRLMGVPYLWGGTSIKGVDCSGFTKTAFLMNGVVIARDASQQVLYGEPIDILTNDTLDVHKALKNLQPGDLLFFAGGKNRRPNARVTHVALYMGDGQFIQSAGKVRINSMLADAPNYDDFQTRTVVAARRYIGHIGDTGLKKVE